MTLREEVNEVAFDCPGIQELNVPPLEPLSIPRLAMENGNGPVRVRAAFSNVTAFGASNYTVGDVRCVSLPQPNFLIATCCANQDLRLKLRTNLLYHCSSSKVDCDR